MRTILFVSCSATARLLFGGFAAWSLLVSPNLCAQIHSNFNDGTDPGWQHYLPDNYLFAPYTVGDMHTSITFETNSSPGGGIYYSFCSGPTNMDGLSVLQAAEFPRVGSFYTNGPVLTNFTMTGEFFHWTNAQSQVIAIAGRVQLPLPPTNQPGVQSTNNTLPPSCLMLAYVNRRSTAAFRGATGGNDELRCEWSNPPANGTPQQLGNNGAFNGPEQPIPVPGRSASPDSTNGHYRLIFTANGINLTGQIVDLSTGLPMTFSGPSTPYTNILRTTTGVYPSYADVGGVYGFYACVGDSATLPFGDPTSGQPIDPHFDNFAIVAGVVTLESAPAATGPYAADTTAGIEVYPKRITVPANGPARYYRINWIGCDHTPAITSTTLAGGNVVLTYD
jgi:hypothetical protein